MHLCFCWISEVELLLYTLWQLSVSQEFGPSKGLNLDSAKSEGSWEETRESLKNTQEVTLSVSSHVKIIFHELIRFITLHSWVKNSWTQLTLFRSCAVIWSIRRSGTFKHRLVFHLTESDSIQRETLWNLTLNHTGVLSKYKPAS